MKAPFSSPATQFVMSLTAGALGLTLLGLPLTATAQQSASNSNTVEAAHTTHRRIYVHHTTWKVEPANSGRKHDYAPVPWVFMPDGSVYSGDLWSGHWDYLEKGKISVNLTMNDGSQDSFIVKFTSPHTFTAYKQGRNYRYGVRL